jgi:hypothetical protein
MWKPPKAPRQLLELVGGGAAFEFRVVGRHFLQADHVRVQLAQHVDDGVDADAPVLPTAPVNVPADNAHVAPPEN